MTVRRHTSALQQRGLARASRRGIPATALTAMLGVLLAAAAIAPPAQSAPVASDTWTVTAPPPDHNAGPVASIVHDEDTGTVSVSVAHGGTTVLEPSPVGIVTEQADLSSGLEFIGRTDSVVTEAYTTTVGKERDRHAVMAESVFSFENGDGARLDLVVRVSDDGVAFRYSLPEDYGSVLGEATAFNVDSDASAWLARWRRDYENPFIEYTAATAPGQDFQVPALFETGGSYLLVTESDLDGSYTGPRLLHESGTGTYRLDFAWDEQVEVDGPLRTPWRVMVVGDLATVTESTLVDDLAPDAAFTDTSWVEPGKVMWTWLAGGRSAQRSLERQKEFVDYAAARGWPYVLVDDGWYDDPETGQRVWTDEVPEWSWVPELVAYAEARGVEIMLWFHHGELLTEQRRAEILPLFHEWGVRGLKIDFMDSESQEILRWYDQILPAAAEHELMVNFHGSNVPKGIHRTWPHVMTMEGVHGGEKSSNLNTSHVVALPFTRNVIGSMDYTPMAFHRPSRPTSDAHEVGLVVLFESGFQSLAGTIEAYEDRPEAVRFLEQVPTTWDETQLITGRPGDHAVIARRSGERWFVGAGVSGAGRTLHVPLGFLRGRWLVELVRDGEAGLVRESHVVTGPVDTLTVDVPDEGGFAAVACRWTPRVQTCDQPVDAIDVPSTTFTVSPAESQLAPGGSMEVSGELTVDDTSVDVVDVTMALDAPDGWTVDGETVRADRLKPGQTLAGSWTFSAPADARDATVDLPVTVSYLAADDAQGAPPYQKRRVARVHVTRPSLAFGKPATQSSLDFGGVPERAVDGNTNGAWSGGSVTHTGFEDQPWWQVDLGAVEDIADIGVWGRTDSCCADRLTDYYVLVSDEPFVSGSLDEVLAQPGVFASHQPNRPSQPTFVEVARTGRYVRVQLAGNNALSLAEVKVFAP